MELLDKALHFAIEKHGGQLRKTEKVPYILHPVEVAAIVGTLTTDENTIAAAVLHDTVEDAGVTFEELDENFGRRVALLVMTDSEEKRPELPPAQTWRLRKEESLIMLANTKDIAVKMMWLGDKLSNMRSFYRLKRKYGDDLWQHFNQKDISQQAWYYRTIADNLKELSGTEAYEEYVSLTEKVFESVKGEAGI